MALGDGIRRNIALVDPAERAMLRDALVQLTQRRFPGSRTDAIPGGVNWWFKQDEIHQGTHVHNGPEFIPWHREIVNRFEEMIRQINPQLSLHYWDWTQDPRNIPNANLGGGTTGNLNLFTSDFMGHGGGNHAAIGEPWLSAGYYVPGANPERDTSFNPADPPVIVNRSINGSPATSGQNDAILNADDYADMRELMENVHDAMHGFVNMGGAHISFRDPFVFLLHSNVDRLFARWQTDPAHPERLEPTTLYGSESGNPGLNGNIEPWSGGSGIRPWAPPESQQEPKNYKHPSIIFPPCYDTNHTAVPVVQVMNPGTPPVINFNDVPTGETSVRAAVFRVYGCGDVTLRVKAPGASAPFSVLQPASGQLTVHHGAHLFIEARLWLAYTAGPAGVAVPDSSITIECPENGKEFTFIVKANAIARPSVAVMLALDQSWSMSWAAGTSGATRVEVLKDAARKFMELIQQGNAVGLIRFDHDSYAVNDPTYPGLAVTDIASNGIFDVGRVAAINAVNNHQPNPGGNTSVGDGVDRARQVLNALPSGAFDSHALIVLTDGLENEPLSIADVAGSIDSRTFAIGLGNETQVNTTALRALANGTGGLLYLTGLLTSSIDDYFRLSKFFLQILAGVTNTDIITDPSGYISPGMRVRIPFSVSDADIDCTPLVMTDENVVNMMLETPKGNVINHTMAAGLGMDFGVGAQTKHYRFTLPVAIGEGESRGLWHVVLEVNRDEFKKSLAHLRERKASHFQSFATHGARYSVAVQTYSNLRLRATVEQNGFEPGADLTFRATLTEYQMPVENRAGVQLELVRPGGSMITLNLSETEPGIFETTVKAAQSGTYHARVMAKGVTFHGAPFTREQLLTAAVWQGGDQPYSPPRDTGKGDWCRLLTCLLSEKNVSREFEQHLKRLGLNLEGLRHCVKTQCGAAVRRRG